MIALVVRILTSLLSILGNIRLKFQGLCPMGFNSQIIRGAIHVLFVVAIVIRRNAAILLI